MIEDFNIRDNDWNLLYPYHSTYMNTLREIANIFSLELSTPIDQVPTLFYSYFILFF